MLVFFLSFYQVFLSILIIKNSVAFFQWNRCDKIIFNVKFFDSIFLKQNAELIFLHHLLYEIVQFNII